MSGLTLLMCAFTIVLYLYLLVVHKEIHFIAVERKLSKIAITIFSVMIILSMLMMDDQLDNQVRGIVSGFVFLSFVLDSRGLALDRIIVHPMSIKGVLYQDIDRVVLFQEKEGQPIKMNYFRKGMRGPLMKFKQPLAELVVFLSEHLNEGTPIDILVDHDQGKND
ncbi:hypothetical protein NGC82_04725 [Enterococcus casseliflavus]|nr:hypothetical protein [Enterococcus casseliflavus]